MFVCATPEMPQSVETCSKINCIVYEECRKLNAVCDVITDVRIQTVAVIYPLFVINFDCSDLLRHRTSEDMHRRHVCDSWSIIFFAYRIYMHVCRWEAVYISQTTETLRISRGHLVVLLCDRKRIAIGNYVFWKYMRPSTKTFRIPHQTRGTSPSTCCRFCFVLEMSWVQILVRRLYKALIVQLCRQLHPERMKHINARQIPSTSSTIHYGLTITPLQAVQPDFPTAALNVQKCNKNSAVNSKNLQTAVARR